MNTSRHTAAALVAASLLGAHVSLSQSLSGQAAQQQSSQQQQGGPGLNPASAAGEPQTETTPSSGIAGQTMKDRIFLRKATEGGLAEVQLGQLASEKATDQEVRDFGSRMVTDHNELNSEIKPIAESLGVMLPKKLRSSDQAEYEKLKGLSGNDFDIEYLTYMVRDHHEDLREFRMEGADTSDPALKAAVEKGAKIIREHTHMVDSLAKAKGIAVPGHGPHPAPPPAP